MSKVSKSTKPDINLSKFDKSQFSTEPILYKREKMWGFEEIFSETFSAYTLKHIHINKGSRTSLQVHDEKTETLVLVKGKCLLSIEDKNGDIKSIEMVPFKGYANTPGQRHRVTAISDCDLFEASTPESGLTYRLEDDYKRENEDQKMREQATKKS